MARQRTRTLGRTGSSNSGGCGCLILIALFIGFALADVAYQHLTDEVVVIKVTDKERSFNSTGKQSFFLIYTEGEVFKNTDAWFSGKFAAADLQGKLQAGQTYKVRVYGWRIPILSRYRNIVRIED